MTPSEIEILLHCHVCPLPHPRVDAPAVAGALRDMLIHGLIEGYDNRGGYRTTARGRAHIEQLCSTPWPTQAWVNVQGELIEVEG